MQDLLQYKTALDSKLHNKYIEQLSLLMLKHICPDSYDQPPIPFDFADSLEWFAEIQRKYHDNYDFLFFGYHCGIIQYDFKKMIFDTYRIGQSDFNNMCILARNEVEKK